MFEEYYGEPDPVKRKAILDEYIPEERTADSEGSDPEGGGAVPEQIKKLFDLRYKCNKKGGYDDRFLGAWLDLKLAAEGPISRMAKKRIEKQVRSAVHVLCLDRRDEFSGDVLYREMCHLATVYISSCTQDSRYTGVFWGLGKISDEKLQSRLCTDLENFAEGLSRFPEAGEDTSILRKAVADTEERKIRS
ncbi:MAG: hypothetical protein LIO75_02655 [Lachnospiraceae bacterium]|nr:hypothetical protein [Lachnospiraceae bacterium]